MIDLALLDNDKIPLVWKEFPNHVGSCRTMNIILQARHTGGEKDTKQRRWTVFFAALDPTCNEPDEEYQDLSRPRMGTLQKKQMESDPGRNLLDQLEEAQDEGLTFWRTDLMPLSLTTQNLLTAFSSGGH